MSIFYGAQLSHYADEFERLIRPSVRINTEAINEDNLPLGSSKIGGRPDLPPHLNWPVIEDLGPLPFIAQINLAELPEVTHPSLPRAGILYFFYFDECRSYDFANGTGAWIPVKSPNDEEDFQAYVYEGSAEAEFRRLCRVFYEISTDQLIRREFPEELDDELRYSPCSLSYSMEWTVPPAESEDIEQLGMGWNQNREDFDRYWEQFLEAFRNELYPESDDMKNRLLGHPDPVQGDMQTECEYLSKGVSYRAEDVKQRLELKPGATKWQLLLQIDSVEEKTGMMWGDVGRIYFWIEKDALERRDFTNVWCILQCG